MSAVPESRRVLRSSRELDAALRSLDRWTIEQVQLDAGSGHSWLVGWAGRRLSVASLSGDTPVLLRIVSPSRYALLSARPHDAMLFEAQRIRAGQCVLLPPLSRCTVRLRADACLNLISFNPPDAYAPDDIRLHAAPPRLTQALQQCNEHRSGSALRSRRVSIERSLQSGIEQMVQAARAGEPLLTPAGRRRMIHAALDHVHANLDKRVSLADLCSVADAGIRTIEYAFRDFCAVSPIRYVRNCRLDRVHAELLNRTPESGAVMQAAMRWGFTHMGQFARDYRQHYGETPSQTLSTGNL